MTKSLNFHLGLGRQFCRVEDEIKLKFRRCQKWRFVEKTFPFFFIVFLIIIIIMVDETELKRRRKEKEEQEEVVAKDEQVAVQKIEKQKTQYESLPKPLVIQYLILLRLINAFTVNTFFQPDEYFQSLEPAHQFAFGYGDLTWEWIDQLRSFNYPFMFYLSFKLSDLLGFGDVGVLLIPKIFQGVVSAISEFYLFTFSQ